MRRRDTETTPGDHAALHPGWHRCEAQGGRVDL